MKLLYPDDQTAVLASRRPDRAVRARPPQHAYGDVLIALRRAAR
jgi:hypothetical protein